MTEVLEKYVRRISNNYNRCHVTAFVRRTSEKKFLRPWGLSLRRQPPSHFGDSKTRLSRPEEFNLFTALHYMKYKIRRGTPRTLPRYLNIYFALRNRAISANWKLIPACVSRYGAKNDVDKLYERGNIALLSAIDRFDPWRGFRLSTYACTAIVRSFYLKDGRTGPMERVNLTSLPLATNEDENESVWIERLTRILLSNDWNKKEMDILLFRFGFSTEPQLTLTQTGHRWGMTKERARQLQIKLLKRLKSELNKDMILNTKRVE